MRRSQLFTVALSALISMHSAAESAANITRDAFIDGLDPVNCYQAPSALYLDTSSQTYDLATALSLSWISLTALESTMENRSAFITQEDIANNWQVTNIHSIENDARDLKIIIADYQDTVLVTFHHTDSHKNWLHNADDGLITNQIETKEHQPSFTLGEQTHDGFSRVLSAQWDQVLSEVKRRMAAKTDAHMAQKLWVFGHGLGAAFAQLSAVGFEVENIHVDQVYLSGSPKVGGQQWVEKADMLLNGRVHRLTNKNDLISRLPVHHDALDEFRAVSSIAIVNLTGGVSSNVQYGSLGRQVSLYDNSHVVWAPSDTVDLEKQYWLDMSDSLADAKHSSWGIPQQADSMRNVISKNLEHHLRSSDDGYFCGMINSLIAE
jgi:hypothetical protein